MKHLQKKKQFLTFNIDEVVCGIDINLVTEIIGMQQFTPIPELPAYIKGIMNLRGKIIPVIDVKLRCYKKETVYDERTSVIVILIDNNEIGLIVDRVHEVISVRSEEEILAMDKENKVFISRIIKLDECVYIILDVEKLIAIE